MTRFPRHRRSIALAIALLSLLLPIRVEAHLPGIGLGPVYDGIFHLLLSPEDLIPVIALALLAGQRGTGSSRRVLWIFPVTWFAGGLTGMFIGTPRGSGLTCLSFLLLGGLIAANATISVPVTTALATLLGFFHGYLNSSGINRFDDGAYFLLGLALAVFVIVALFTSFVIPLRRQWALIVVRVAGSWIAASGLLMLGWALRR
jgi:hydrogenase/urease accessory protein HupE